MSGLRCFLRLWWCPGPHFQQGQWQCLWYYCSQGLCRCPFSVLPTRAMGMSMMCAATWSHVDAHGLYFCRGSWWCVWPVLLPEVMLLFMACAATEAYDGVCGLCISRGLCPWSLQPLETIMMSMVHSYTWDHVGVCGQRYLQNPYVSLWSIHLLAIKGKQSTLLCIDNSRLTADNLIPCA